MQNDVTGRLVELSQGMYIDRDVLGVIDEIKRLWPNIEVKYLNPDMIHLGVGDAPYALFENCPDGIQRLVFTTWQLDNRVIDRLYAADTANVDVLAKIEATNAAAKKAIADAKRDKGIEAMEIAAYAANSPKGTYTVEIDNKRITIDDDPNRPYSTAETIE